MKASRRQSRRGGERSPGGSDKGSGAIYDDDDGCGCMFGGDDKNSLPVFIDAPVVIPCDAPAAVAAAAVIPDAADDTAANGSSSSSP